MTEREQLDLCQTALSLAGAGRAASIDLCAALDAVYEARAFEVSQYGDEHLFLMELGLKQSQVSKYKAIGRAMRVYGFPRAKLIDVVNIEGAYLAARQKDRETALAVLDDATRYSFSDLKKIVDKVDECSHEWHPLPLRCCAKCGHKELAGDNPVDTR